MKTCFPYFQGDSGGPLVVVNPGGRIEVVGIVSWGFKCGMEGLPTVLTKIQFFLDWIKENIQVLLPWLLKNTLPFFI